MVSVLTFEEIRKAEEKIIKGNFQTAVDLMEKAGKNSYQIINNSIPNLQSFKIIIICGKGNNAGDGFTIARYLANNGFKVRVLLLVSPDELKGPAKVNYERLSEFQNIKISPFNSYFKDEKILIVDCILGTGIKGKPSKLF